MNPCTEVDRVNETRIDSLVICLPDPDGFPITTLLRFICSLEAEITKRQSATALSMASQNSESLVSQLLRSQSWYL
jgi:hypothetical protein